MPLSIGLSRSDAASLSEAEQMKLPGGLKQSPHRALACAGRGREACLLVYPLQLRGLQLLL